MSEWSVTWTWIDGTWHEGNVPIIGSRSHAAWLGSSVFDGGRIFEGTMPDIDLHAQRVNNSAKALGLNAGMRWEEILELTKEGAQKFSGDVAIYVRPMYWAERGGLMEVAADPDSTRFCLCLFEAPMPTQGGMSVTLSPFRRPTMETMPTDAKAGCLYPNNARCLTTAREAGFDNALVLDMLGNVAELATANVFLVKDGVVATPVPNGTFLSGITRGRVIQLLRDAGHRVDEATLSYQDFKDADEIFSTGNYSKVKPILKIDDRELQPGPVGAKARELYWNYAHA